ncbi:MAG TPA: class I SAM-dependent methyltransferase [Myxococcota bacterium]|nr:class I SAM-dependent methyltransferase [Myxococcota bacterium]
MERALSVAATPSSLDDPQVKRVLERLHGAARGDVFRMLGRAPTFLRSLLGRSLDPAEMSRRFKDVYIPLSRPQGKLLYLVARSLDAKRIVEFGTSFGVSTLYAAAAARDNGLGRVIGSELEPGKRAKALEHLNEAGLGGCAEVRLGNALQTLRDVPAPIDLVLLDGWKDLYLPMIELLAPKLRSGAVVLADNVRTFKRALAPYLDYVQSGRNGFQSVTLPFPSGFEYSVRT